MNLVKGAFSDQNDEKLLYNSEFQNHNWRETGKTSGQSHGGSEAGLLTCLQRILHDFYDMLSRDKATQEESKTTTRSKLDEIQSAIDNDLSRISEIEEEKIPPVKGRIRDILEAMLEIQRNPDGCPQDKTDKVGFILGIAILALLTVYLFIFYSSASFSAFFREFTLYSGVMDSIFDSNALSKSLNNGMAALIFILTIPSVFFGMGFLVHRLMEKNEKSFFRFLKIAPFVIVTFIFDGILAYVIEKKIYDVAQINSFQDLPDFTLSMAFQSSGFWLIIFAGFVTSLIWGCTLHFTMEAYAKLDMAQLLLNARQKELDAQNNKLMSLETTVSGLKEDIRINITEKTRLSGLLNTSGIYNPEELKAYIHQFAEGWQEYLSFKKVPESEKQNAKKLVVDFINSNINQSNSEELAYAWNS